MSTTDIDRAHDALHFLPADCCREDWHRIGRAAIAAGLSVDELDTWSATAANYKGSRDVQAAFRTIKPEGGTQAGTLFRLAKDAGWRDSGEPAAPRPQQATKKPVEPPHKVAPGMGATEIFNRCEAATNSHPYLVQKGAAGVPLDNLRVVPAGDSLMAQGESMAGALVVPVMRPDGTLASLQFIAPPDVGARLKAQGKPDKPNLRDHHLDGGWFTVGELTPGGTVHICEGVGAAWSCWQASSSTPSTAAVGCFGSGNMRKVAAALRLRDPTAKLVLVADVGKEKQAEAIAKEVNGATVFMPDGWPDNSDVNDLHQTEEGALELLLEAAIESPPEPASQKAKAEAGDEAGSPFGSELALSDELAKTATGLIRWTPGLEWMANNGTHWEKDDSLRRFSLAKSICRNAASGLDSNKLSSKICSAGTHGAILSLARSSPGIITGIDEWDRHPMVLNTPNAAIDLETGLEVSRDGLLFTQVAGASPSSIPTPVWDKFIHEVFGGDLEMVEFMQRMGGYGLTGSIKEQKLFFLHGNGANGKSVFLDVLRALGGRYSYNLPSEALMTSKHESHPTMLASLHGKRLAISSEIEESAHWAEARIKAMTGDETMTARYMRQDFFTFRVTHKHVIAGNFKPRLKGDDFAMVRRMVLVPFTQRFEGARRDNDLPEKLKAEYPGIMRWFIEGARKWAQTGLAIPAAITEASREYMAEQDDISLWVASCCEGVPGSRELATNLFSSFEAWKRRNGEYAGSGKTFSQRLERIYDKKRMNKGVEFIGLRLVLHSFDDGFQNNAYEAASRGE